MSTPTDTQNIPRAVSGACQMKTTGTGVSSIVGSKTWCITDEKPYSQFPDLVVDRLLL